MRPLASQSPSLLIDDASLASLVAAASASSPNLITPWVVPPDDASASRVHAIAARKAELFATRDPVHASSPGEGPYLASRLLLEACEAAATLGLSKVIWPAAFGADVDALADAIDLARLVSHVSLVQAGPAAPTVEIPLADLTDAHLVEAALDLGAPLSAEFWLAPEGEQDRWRAAIAATDNRAAARLAAG